MLNKLTITALTEEYKKKINDGTGRENALRELRTELESIKKNGLMTSLAKKNAHALLNERWIKVVDKTMNLRPSNASSSTRSGDQPAPSLTINGPVERAIQNNNNAIYVEDADQTRTQSQPQPPSSSPLASEEETREEEAPRSPESYASDNYHPTRQYLHLYDNVETWGTTVDQWMVNDLDVKDLLREFRDSSILLAQTQGNISDKRILSLYSIFPFMQERSDSVTKYMNIDMHDVVKDEFFKIYGRPSAPNEKLVMWCSQLSIFDADWLKVKDKCLDFMNEVRSTEDVSLRVASYVLFDLAPKLVRSVDPAENAEDTFIHNYLNPYLDNIFSTEKLFYQAWANLTLNNSNGNLKPDWTLYIKPWFTKVDITSCEVKPPGKVGRGDISDYVKIGLELKDMLNSLVQLGVQDGSVFGILVEGANISFYGMDSVGPAYRLYQIANSQLITKSSQLPLFPTLFDAFRKVKDLALETAIKVDRIQRLRALGKRIQPEPSRSSGSSSPTPTLKKQKRVNAPTPSSSSS